VNPTAGLDDFEKRKFLTLPGLELRPHNRPARSQSLYRLRYPGSLFKGMGWKYRIVTLLKHHIINQHGVEIKLQVMLKSSLDQGKWSSSEIIRREKIRVNNRKQDAWLLDSEWMPTQL
jgi:hypothetical protein